MIGGFESELAVAGTGGAGMGFVGIGGLSGAGDVRAEGIGGVETGVVFEGEVLMAGVEILGIEVEVEVEAVGDWGFGW